MDVTKKYDKKFALRGIHLEIPKGVCYGLIGPNGAGKSTIMKILTTILDEFEGECLFDHMNMKKEKESIRKMIGYVPQDITLIEELSAVENLKFFGKLYGIKGEKLNQRVDTLLKMVGLFDRRKEVIKSYSGGMKRRINIACALIHEPSYIFMDEPTVGVDPQSRKLIFDIIHQLKMEGNTILYSSHYMEEIELLADKIALIDKGKIIDQGDKNDLLERYTKPSIYIEGKNVEVSFLEKIGKTAPKREGWIVEVEDGLSSMKEIANYHHQHQREIKKLELYKRNLEDVFFELTGSTLRD